MGILDEVNDDEADYADAEASDSSTATTLGDFIQVGNNINWFSTWRYSYHDFSLVNDRPIPFLN